MEKIEYEDLVVYAKNNRNFTGNLKTKEIPQYAIVTFADNNNDNIVEKEGILIDMYRKESGGSYHSFELDVNGKKQTISISLVISWKKVK